MTVIKIRQLTKRFKDLVAVDHLDLDIFRGECFGLLGPNGAGKTTLIRMITAIILPSEGHIEVLGMDIRLRPREIKAKLGVVPQHDNLDADLKVKKQPHHICEVLRHHRIRSKKKKRGSAQIF